MAKWQNGKMAKQIKKYLLLIIFLTFASCVPSITHHESTKARAEAGDTEAQYYLGLQYDIGSGVTPNISEAIKWYRLAAEKGHATAQLSLAMKYKNGEGVPRSEQEAIKWYTLSAEQGTPGALIGLRNLQAKLGLATQQQEAQTLSLETQCASFGFNRNTPEMANCLLELYKIANQPQQTTQSIGDLYPDTARGNTADPAAAIEMFNISRDILNNTGTRAAPAPTSVRCTRVGDFSRQVFSFNGIACPFGYAPSF